MTRPSVDIIPEIGERGRRARAFFRVSRRGAEIVAEATDSYACGHALANVMEGLRQTGQDDDRFYRMIVPLMERFPSRPGDLIELMEREGVVEGAPSDTIVAYGWIRPEGMSWVGGATLFDQRTHTSRFVGPATFYVLDDRDLKGDATKAPDADPPQEE